MSDTSVEIVIEVSIIVRSNYQIVFGEIQFPSENRFVISQCLFSSIESGLLSIDSSKTQAQGFSICQNKTIIESDRPARTDYRMHVEQESMACDSTNPGTGIFKTEIVRAGFKTTYQRSPLIMRLNRENFLSHKYA